jgi:hypothetical protein
MLESIASIGVGGLLMLVFGYLGLFYLARIIESRDPYDDEGDSDE